MFRFYILKFLNLDFIIYKMYVAWIVTPSSIFANVSVKYHANFPRVFVDLIKF